MRTITASSLKCPRLLGARTAGYFGKGKKGFERFFLAVPARADHGAEMWIYTVQGLRSAKRAIRR